MPSDDAIAKTDEPDSPTPIKTVVIDQICPSLATEGLDSIIKEGSLLYYLPEEDSGTSLWAITSGVATPVLVRKFDETIFSAMLSPNGKLLALEIEEQDKPVIIIVDLSNGMETRVDPGIDLFDIESWRSNSELILGVDEDHELGFGITKEIIKYDTDKDSLSNETITYNLPGYAFIPYIFLQGYSISNSEADYFLYTAFEDGITEIRLIDTNTNNIIWKMPNVIDPMLRPSWAPSGKQAALTFVTDEPDFEYMNIYTLTTRGELTQLTNQSLDQYDNYIIRNFEWSPNESFLHYSLWETSTSGPGFILEIESSEIRSICDENPPYQFRGGDWLRNGQFLYYTDYENSIEDRILDIYTWQYYHLATYQSGESGIRIIDWTPISFQ